MRLDAPNQSITGHNLNKRHCRNAVTGGRQRLVSRIALTAYYLGGAILALGVLCVGLSMPKPGWRALSERVPDWLISIETGSLAAVLGLTMMAVGTAVDRRSRMTRKNLVWARDAASPKVWGMQYPGGLDVLAAYCGPDDGPEARKKRIKTSARNRFGQQLEASDFPLVLHAMGDPPDAPQDFCSVSGQFPMVSPRLAELLRMLDLGNGSFFEAKFYTEDGVERLPWSHAFWNIGNRKESFLPDKSGLTRVTSGSPDTPPLELYATKGSLQENEIAVGPESLNGPDVWIEPKVSNCIFFSDRFAQLMQEYGLLHLFDLKPVRLIVPD